MVIKKNKDLFEANGVKEGGVGIILFLERCNCTCFYRVYYVTTNRAIWNMGLVKDQYIHYEKAGDQFVGRHITIISTLGKDFDTLLVYWDFTNQPIETRHEN